jgi:hypothetical protein
MNKMIIIFCLLAALIWGGSLGLAELLVPDPNPSPRNYGVILGDKADQILRQSCFDCHSNETQWPWYNSMPMVSVLVAHDVQEGRAKLNFSEWNRMPDDKKRESLQESLEEITEGEMPPMIYTLMHPESKITGEELTILKNSTSSTWGILSDVDPEQAQEKD